MQKLSSAQVIDIPFHDSNTHKMRTSIIVLKRVSITQLDTFDSSCWAVFVGPMSPTEISLVTEPSPSFGNPNPTDGAQTSKDDS